MRYVLLLTIVGAVAVRPDVASCAHARQDQPRQISAVEFRRFIFFAVLEGLFEDGVPNKLVERVLEADAKGAYVNFVYGCPICMPAVEAFRAFATRWDTFYYAQKGESYFHGPSVPDDIAKVLDDSDAAKRRAGLQKLIERHVKRRMDLLHLDEGERKAWRAAIEGGRKKGMELLQAQKLDLKQCPTCDGAEAGGPK